MPRKPFLASRRIPTDLDVQGRLEALQWDERTAPRDAKTLLVQRDRTRIVAGACRRYLESAGGTYRSTQADARRCKASLRRAVTQEVGIGNLFLWLPLILKVIAFFVEVYFSAYADDVGVACCVKTQDAKLRAAKLGLAREFGVLPHRDPATGGHVDMTGTAAGLDTQVRFSPVPLSKTQIEQVGGIEYLTVGPDLDHTIPGNRPGV